MKIIWIQFMHLKYVYNIFLMPILMKNAETVLGKSWIDLISWMNRFCIRLYMYNVHVRPTTCMYYVHCTYMPWGGGVKKLSLAWKISLNIWASRESSNQDLEPIQNTYSIGIWSRAISRYIAKWGFLRRFLVQSMTSGFYSHSFGMG